MKAYEQPKESITLTPATSFADKRYTFGTISADGHLVTPGAGAAVCGVVQTPGIIGEPCNVMTSGVSFVKLGGTVAAGDSVTTDASGKAVKVTSTEAVAGICLTGGATDEIGCILLK